MSTTFAALFDRLTSTEPRPSLHPIPGTNPLMVGAALLPPVLYYIALLLLPPAPPSALDNFFVKALRNLIALLAAILFFRLPLAFHVPQSIGLTYQLGLVGLYGGCRVFDAFFISPYLFNHIPKRVAYTHHVRDDSPTPDHQALNQEQRLEKIWSDGGLKDPFGSNGSSESTKKPKKPKPKSDNDLKVSSSDQNSGSQTTGHFSVYQTTKARLKDFLAGPDPTPVIEHAHTESKYPHTLADRASWALEFELSMRGVGFSWTTADVRHSRETWLPTIANRVHSILVYVLPVQIGAWLIISTIYKHHLAATIERADYDPFFGADARAVARNRELFDNLTYTNQLLLTLALGAFLMSAFSLGHSLFAIMLHPLSPSPLAFFPPLYTTRVWNITSVRKFWSFGWHRLFARLFLVYGVWPGEYLERLILGKRADEPADIGKVLGAFVSSAFVHSFSVRCVVAGRWADASGEARFFALNGLAVVVEELVRRTVERSRRRSGRRESAWYDAWIGRAWWVSVLLWTGRNFARGWVKSGLVREMAFR